MTNLSNWDFSADFTGAEVVALAFGLDPNRTPSLASEEIMFAPALERMKQCYDKARDYYQQSMSPPEFPDWIAPVDMLLSADMRWHICHTDIADVHYCDFYQWVTNDERSRFETQRFPRQDIIQWLAAIAGASVYAFDKAASVTSNVADVVAPAPEIDPEDLPYELDCANVAFRAVTNGYGDPAATFKNRLLGYLNEKHSALAPDAISRIATVANPDKSPGRPKRASK